MDWLDRVANLHGLSGLFVILVGVLAFVLACAWIFLPFAIFGVHGRLDAILRELKKLNGAGGVDAQGHGPPARGRFDPESGQRIS